MEIAETTQVIIQVGERSGGLGASEWIACAAAVLTAGGLFLSWKAMKSAQRAATQGLLAEQMAIYLQGYSKALEGSGVPGTLQDFGRLAPAGRRALEILAGQLIGVIDLMIDLKDPRLKDWRAFIGEIPGALAGDEGFQLEAYARHDETKQIIEEARARIVQDDADRRAKFESAVEVVFGEASRPVSDEPA